MNIAIFCCTISVLEAATFSKRSFIVEGAVFTPDQGLKVEVSMVDRSSLSPLPTCEQCAAKWKESGVIDAVVE